MVARTHDDTSHEVEYIAGFTPEHDVATVRIEGAGLPFVHLGSSDGVKAGDHVTVVGAPLGLESTVSDGIISAVRGTGAFHIFQTSAPISHGSSGGPLFDDYGNVVALAIATIEQGENLNFAVPIDSAKALLSNQQHMTFAELLQTTAVHQPILSSSISIPPQAVGLDITVPQQGGLLTGSFSIAGGFGNGRQSHDGWRRGHLECRCRQKPRDHQHSTSWWTLQAGP
jgi:S1-C subfamily serine protease